MKKLMILLIFMLALAGSVSADWVYQETQDSYSNTADYTNIGNFFDGNWTWDSYAQSDGGLSGHININYTLYEGATSAIWQYFIDVGQEETIRNVTIPESCFGDVIQIQLDFHDEEGFTGWNESCYDGEAWIELVAERTEAEPVVLYHEEGMFWNVTASNNAPTINVASPSDNLVTTDFDIDFTFTPTDADADLVNCSLYAEGSLSSTTENIVSGTATTISHSFTNYDTDSWLISCTDGTDTTNSSTYSLTVRQASGSGGGSSYVAPVTDNVVVDLEVTGEDNSASSDVGFFQSIWNWIKGLFNW